MESTQPILVSMGEVIEVELDNTWLEKVKDLFISLMEEEVFFLKRKGNRKIATFDFYT